MQFCRQPNCRAIVPRGYCRAHARAVEAARGTARERGYRYRWEVRSKQFRSRYPLCGMRPDNRPPVMSRCIEENRATLADLVDHVIPHRGDPVLFWDEQGNWQSLCASCHRRKTNAGL
jgi:5-methylcytosine-specific restriction protein A